MLKNTTNIDGLEVSSTTESYLRCSSLTGGSFMLGSPLVYSPVSTLARYMCFLPLASGGEYFM